MRKTEVNKKAASGAVAPVPEEEVLCYVGDARLFASATTDQQAAFAIVVEQQSDDALLAASVNPENGDTWRDLFLEVLQTRAKKQLVGAKK